MIAILAFGSLIDDPGREIQEATIDCRMVRTPFKVEFARYSDKRGGAPTLVPVEEGGSSVEAVLLVLAEAVSLQDARDLLWRRETQQVGSSKKYRATPKPGPNKVLIRELEGFESFDTVLYVDFPPEGKVRNPNPADLAERAIASAKACGDERDGITYLIRAKANGIVTPLMAEYEAKILEKTCARSLDEALRLARDP